jgi:hypothetical protein
LGEGSRLTLRPQHLGILNVTDAHIDLGFDRAETHRRMRHALGSVKEDEEGLFASWDHVSMVDCFG